MKRKSCIYVNDDLAMRLTAAADQLGVSKSGLVAAALHRFLDTAEGRDGSSPVEQDLAEIRRQLNQLDHDLRIVNETVAMHARYHLTVTPPIAETAQRAACVIGAARFDEFASQIARRVHTGRPLIRETLENLSTKRPDLPQSEDALPPGDPVIGQGLMTSNLTNGHADPQTSMRSAAAWEDGSSGNFHTSSFYRPHSTVRRGQT